MEGRRVKMYRKWKEREMRKRKCNVGTSNGQTVRKKRRK
jgi:hypothetical protein